MRSKWVRKLPGGILGLHLTSAPNTEPNTSELHRVFCGATRTQRDADQLMMAGDFIICIARLTGGAQYEGDWHALLDIAKIVSDIEHTQQ